METTGGSRGGDDLGPHVLMSRRTFLALTSGAMGALALGCSGSDSDTPDPADDDPWAILEELLVAVRASPDHRTEEANRLVAAGDVGAIVGFVQSQIAAVPTRPAGMVDPSTRRRWGTGWALRGGAGTPREKADLLVDLLARAGVEAEVVAAPLPDGPALLADRVRPAEPVPFAPVLAEDRVDELLALFERNVGASGTHDEQPATEVTPTLLAERVLGVAGPAVEVVLPQSDIDAYWPFVLVGDELVDPCGTAALAPLAVRHRTVSAAGGTPDITVRLQLVRSHQPPPLGTRGDVEVVDLLEGSWNIEDLVGRFLHVSTAPATPGVHPSLVPPASVRWFTPTLLLSGEDATTRGSVTGPAFSLRGEVQDADDQVATTTSPPGAADLDRVEEVGIASVNPATHPDVTLAISVLDADGAQVPRIAAGDVSLVEDGVPHGFEIAGDGISRTRVLLLVDQSGSIDPAFRGAALGPFLQGVIAGMVDGRPEGSVLEARVMPLNGSPLGPWSADVAELDRQVAALGRSNSYLYAAIQSAIGATEPTAVILVSDGAATDTDPASYHDALVAGPPIHVVLVGGDPDGLTIATEIAELSRGTLIQAADGASAIGPVVAALAGAPPEPYRIRYTSPRDGARTRTVSVTIAGHSATTTFDVPATALPAPSALGLLMSVDYDGTTVRRRLVGYDPADRREPSAADIEATQLGLFGSTMLTFEAAPPSEGQIQDDLLTAVLAQRPVIEALDKPDDIGGALDAVGLLPPTTRHLLSLPVRYDPEEPVTWESGLQVVAHSIRFRPVDDESFAVRRSIDLLPCSAFRAVADDPARAARAAATRSARLAILESSLGNSTVDVFTDAELVLLEALRDLDGDRDTALIEVLRPWDVRGLSLAVAGDHRLGGWAVHHDTGSFWGITEDGYGGGHTEASIKGQFAKVQKLLAIIGLVNDVLGLLGVNTGLGLAYGAWAALEAAKVAQLERATIAIATLGEGGRDPGNPSAGQLACPFGELVGLEVLAPVLAAAVGPLRADRISKIYSVLNGALSGGTFKAGTKGTCDALTS